MEWIDAFFKLSLYLHKLGSRLISFFSRKRKYSPERTKKNIEVSISAQEGTIVFWCDKGQSKLNVILEFKNNNPFPIEIDRVEISGYFNAASMKAVDLFGARLDKYKKENIYLEGKLDESNLSQIKQAKDDETLRLEVRAIIINKHYCIRDFRYSFDRLRCQRHNRF